jgi:hypothetical protein
MEIPFTLSNFLVLAAAFIGGGIMYCAYLY